MTQLQGSEFCHMSLEKDPKLQMRSQCLLTPGLQPWETLSQTPNPQRLGDNKWVLF